jgi:hypothetical protein
MHIAYIVNDMGSQYWGVQTYKPELGYHTYDTVFETKEGAEAYCKEKGLVYEIDSWKDAFTQERAYASSDYKDSLEYLYEVAP